MLFTQILHKKQTQKIKERLLILRDSALKGTVAQGNSWHRGVGTEPAGKKSYERRRGRWRPGLCRAVKDTGAQLLVGGARLCTRRELGSRAHTRLPLWKSAAGRFVRRGLTGIRASPPGPKALTRAPCPVSATLPPPLVLRGSRGRLVLPSNTRLHSVLCLWVPFMSGWIPTTLKDLAQVSPTPGSPPCPSHSFPPLLWPVSHPHPTPTFPRHWALVQNCAALDKLQSSSQETSVSSPVKWAS